MQGSNHLEVNNQSSNLNFKPIVIGTLLIILNIAPSK